MGISAETRRRCKEEREGMVATSLDGVVMTLTEYNTADNCTVTFEDGAILHNVDFYLFRSGKVYHPSHINKTVIKKIKIKEEREGMTVVNNNGMKMTLVEYIDCEHCTVEFENGLIRHNVFFSNFKNGNVYHPSFKNYYTVDNTNNILGKKYIGKDGLEVTIIDVCKLNNIRICTAEYDDGTRFKANYFTINNGYFYKSNIPKVGETAYNKTGQLMEIIQALYYNRYTVKFDDGTILNDVSYDRFKQGTLKNPNFYLNSRGRVNSGSHIGNIQIHSLLYRGKHQHEVYYMCKCEKCGLKFILTPSEMLKHVCD